MGGGETAGGKEEVGGKGAKYGVKSVVCAKVFHQGQSCVSPNNVGYYTKKEYVNARMGDK